VERGYDPVVLAEATRRMVEKEGGRKYYRFRGGRWYGGIATADCVGCNLRCVFCWSNFPRDNPSMGWRLYSPEEVYLNLVGIAEKRKYRLLRISGNEPTISWGHLMKILELVEEDGRFEFILETNGILIGDDESKARDLSGFTGLHVRVSLKGTCEEEFSILTGARPEAFGLQLKALENLADCNVPTHPAACAGAPGGDALLLKQGEPEQAAGEAEADNPGLREGVRRGVRVPISTCEKQAGEGWADPCYCI